MDWIIFKNKEYQNKFDFLVSTKCNELSKTEKSLIKIIIINYKKYSLDEYYVLLWFIYMLVFYWIIDSNNIRLSNADKSNIKLLQKCYKYEIEWDKNNFIDLITSMDNDLFILKIVIKYSILSFDHKYLNMIKNPDNYIKSIWYMIPYITLKEINLLWFFQDIYFEKLYKKEYNKTKKNYYKNINNTDLPWSHLVDIVNDLSKIMCIAKTVWRVKLRKKTFFSIYNKLIRKATKKIDDSIWARIIFLDLENMYRFVDYFEDTCVFNNKKDYYLFPKSNWYKSIHYTFISPYKDMEIKVDLQIRTQEIVREIKKTKNLTHYSYTVKQNKWAELFKEVNYWYEYMEQSIKKA